MVAVLTSVWTPMTLTTVNVMTATELDLLKSHVQVNIMHPTFPYIIIH